METWTYFIIYWIVCWFVLFTYPYLRVEAKVWWKWWVSVWERVTGYLYDLGADLEGIEPCSKEDED
jgi:hypothetical protein